MKRHSTPLLIVGFLLGAGATCVLLFGLLGPEEGGPVRTSPNDPRLANGTLGGTPARPGGRTAPKVYPTRQGGGTNTQSGRPGSGRSLVRSRTPHDGPSGPKLLEERALRIIAILDAFPETKDATTRQKLGMELARLVRAQGKNVDPAVKEHLFRMLVDDERYEWKQLAGKTLGALVGDAETAQKLLEFYKTAPDRRTRHAIHIALRGIRAPEIIGDLLASINAGDEEEFNIVKTIGAIGDENSRKALLDKLPDVVRPETRREIERVLALRADPELIKQIKKELPDAEAGERLSYVRILGRTRDPEHGKAIRELLQDETDERVTREALKSLGLIGDKKSVELLLTYMKREDGLAPRAQRAFQQVRNVGAIEQVADSWDTLGQRGRNAVMYAAGRVTLTKPVAELAERALQDSEWRVRSSAARALGRRGREESIDLLTNYMYRHKAQREQTPALNALYKIETRRAAQEALRNLDNLRKPAREAQCKRFERQLEMLERRPQNRR
ncbi:MAG: HEAT repeat domain-containing protein [Planctomycetota bacterium]|nr:HEAT repeat domain-containing protein [Planctomycetota bacterium]